jgi:hypothetical protein
LRSTAASAPANTAATAPNIANAAMIQNTIVRLRLRDLTCEMVCVWVETSTLFCAKYRRSGSTSSRLRAYRRNAG